MLRGIIMCSLLLQGFAFSLPNSRICFWFLPYVNTSKNSPEVSFELDSLVSINDFLQAPHPKSENRRYAILSFIKFLSFSDFFFFFGSSRFVHFWKLYWDKNKVKFLSWHFFVVSQKVLWRTPQRHAKIKN